MFVLRGAPFEKSPEGETEDDSGETDRPPRIRCPKCGWEVRRGDLWSCLCGHAWNTFDTGGRCPECREQWDHTQCLACHEWSPHEQWYER